MIRWTGDIQPSDTWAQRRPLHRHVRSQRPHSPSRVSPAAADDDDDNDDKTGHGRRRPSYHRHHRHHRRGAGGYYWWSLCGATMCRDAAYLPLQPRSLGHCQSAEHSPGRATWVVRVTAGRRVSAGELSTPRWTPLRARSRDRRTTDSSAVTLTVTLTLTVDPRVQCPCEPPVRQRCSITQQTSLITYKLDRLL